MFNRKNHLGGPSRAGSPNLRLLRLENRLCPSVTAALVAGTLTITGNDGSDIVDVTTRSDGDILVKANNGQLTKTFEGNDVDTLVVDLGDGFNELNIDLTVSNGSDGDHEGFDQNPVILVTSGVDNDTVTVNLGDDAGGGGGGNGDDDGRGDVFMSFDLGSANDYLTITAGGDFGGTFGLYIDTSNGSDTVTVALDSDLDGDATVDADLGIGNDQMSFEVTGDVKSYFEFFVDAGTGNDYVTTDIGGTISGDSVIDVALGTGNDNFSMSVGGDIDGAFDFFLTGDTGNDYATLNIGGDVAGDFTADVDMGSSNDNFQLIVAGSAFGAFVVDVITDSGNDVVGFDIGGDVDGVMELTVDLGSGNDELTVTVAGNFASDNEVFMDFDGGIGLDSLTYNIAPGELDDINFSAINFEDVTENDVQVLSPTFTPGLPNATIVVNDGSSQRSRVTSLTVTFSTAVIFPLGVNSAFTLERTGPTGPTGPVALAYSVAGNVVTITFADPVYAPASGGGSLMDGNYAFMLSAEGIRNSVGFLDGNADGVGGDDQSLLTHRLFGDGDGDGAVTANDFALFRKSFGTSLNLAFDANGDGIVGSDDFAAFRMRFGVTMVP